MKYNLLLCFVVFVFFQTLLAQVLVTNEDSDPWSRSYARARYAVMLNYGPNEDFISYAFTINSDQVPGTSGSLRVGAISRYEKVMVSENQVIIRAWIAGTTAIVAELLTEVTEGVDYTFLLRRKSDGFWITKVVDDNSLVADNQFRVRVIHNTYDTGSVLDLVEGSTVLISSIAPGDISGYEGLESGVRLLALIGNLGQASPSQLPSIAFGNRISATIWVLGNPLDTNPLNRYRTIVSLDYQPTSTQFPIPQSTNGMNGVARIRFASVCPSVANAQFQLGKLPVQSLNYGEFSDYMAVNQGRNSYSIFQTGQRFVAIGALYLTQNHDYTLFLRMRLDAIPEAYLVEDYSHEPAVGYSNVRWINLMNVVAPSVDLSIEFHKFVDNLKFSGVSRYLPIDINSPPMYGTLRMVEHTGEQRILAVVPNFRDWFFTDQTYTVVIAGDAIAPKFIVMHEDGSNMEADTEHLSHLFDDLIVQSIKMNHSVGVSGAIGMHRVNRSSVFWAKSYGWSQKEHKNRNTINTMFLVGAVGDLVISYLTFLKASEESIDMNSNIESVVGFEIVNPNTGKSSFSWNDLLTHTSSIADNRDMYLRVLAYNGDSNVGNCEFVREYLQIGGRYFSEENFYSESEMDDNAYHFSHMNFALLSCAHEKMTGRTFADLADEYIFQSADHLAPQGLRRTTYFYSSLANFRRSAYNYMPLAAMSPMMNMSQNTQQNPMPNNGSMMSECEMMMMMNNNSMIVNGSLMLSNGTMLNCSMMVNHSNGMMRPYWVPVRRASLPIYPAFGLQTTPSDLVSIMTYIAFHHPQIFDMMTEEANITGPMGMMVTRGGAYRRTLSDGNDVFGFGAWPLFGDKPIMEFSLTAGVFYSKVQGLAVSFVSNTMMDQMEIGNWFEKSFLTINAASLMAEYGPRRYCQNYVSQNECELGSECKWIKPLTVQAAGGICVKSVAVAVKVLHPSARLSPLNLRDY